MELNKKLKFENWLDVFMEEKEVNTERVFEFINSEGIWNYMPLSVVIEFIKQLPNNQKDQIKTQIMKIDFVNGNVYNFFEYLAKGINQF